MSIISVAAAVSMRRTHEAFEKRLKEAKDREYRRREEERRRNEENKRRREEERRRDEENKRRQERREKEALYTKHSRETIDEVSAFETVTTFSAKCLHSKDEVFDKIVSYDGYAYRCADGSSITEDVDGQYYVKKLSNGVTQTYKELGARELGANAEVMYLLSREDLPDGRARVYDTKCRGSSSDGRYKTYTDEENKYFISYECDADGSYRRYDVTEEKEDESYANYRSDIPYKTILIDDVKAETKMSVSFSAKCLHSKDEVFDKIVSYDGYAYRCADGSSITEDVDGQYYVKKLSNGVTQTYKELGARELGANAEVMYLLSREDLPDGRARVYDTKCRGSSSSGRYRSYTDKENNYFISYECDADGSYRRYDVTEEKEDESYANYRSDIPYKTILVDDVKAETKMYTLSKENTEHKGVSLELEKMKKKVKNRQLSGVAVADKIAEDIISGREKRTITYEVGQELSDKYKREYALSKKQNEGK